MKIFPIFLPKVTITTKIHLSLQSLQGSTTLNKLPIEIRVNRPSFKGLVEAFSARNLISVYNQSIQIFLKFNICFNVWGVFQLDFALQSLKQRPLCFSPVFKPHNANRSFRVFRTYFHNKNNIFHF